MGRTKLGVIRRRRGKGDKSLEADQVDDAGVLLVRDRELSQPPGISHDAPEARRRSDVNVNVNALHGLAHGCRWPLVSVLTPLQRLSPTCNTHISRPSPPLRSTSVYCAVYVSTVSTPSQRTDEPIFHLVPSASSRLSDSCDLQVSVSCSASRPHAFKPSPLPTPLLSPPPRRPSHQRCIIHPPPPRVADAYPRLRARPASPRTPISPALNELERVRQRRRRRARAITQRTRAPGTSQVLHATEVRGCPRTPQTRVAPALVRH